MECIEVCVGNCLVVKISLGKSLHTHNHISPAESGAHEAQKKHHTSPAESGAHKAQKKGPFSQYYNINIWMGKILLSILILIFDGQILLSILILIFVR